jgi:hypothetical protein
MNAKARPFKVEAARKQDFLSPPCQEDLLGPPYQEDLLSPIPKPDPHRKPRNTIFG